MPISTRPRRPVRAGSVPVSAWQRQHLGHHDRVRAMDRARHLERATYRRGRGTHGGYLRETGLRVLWAILYRGMGRAGALDPSYGQLAEATRLARSTVQIAVSRLETAGILWRVARYHVAAHGREQATNAYLIRPPEAVISDTDARAALDSSVLRKKELREEVFVEVEHRLLDSPPPDEISALASRWGL